MPLNIATLTSPMGTTYKTDTRSEECHIHPSSVLFAGQMAAKQRMGVG
jgi:hypothetical protein